MWFPVGTQNRPTVVAGSRNSSNSGPNLVLSVLPCVRCSQANAMLLTVPKWANFKGRGPELDLSHVRCGTPEVRDGE